MQETLYFIITVGILVFVHELGHFLAAKATKMRTDAFAIGFGYRLFGWNKINGFSFGNLPKDFDTQGYTDYRLNLLPLGGYVKIAGMVDESNDTNFANNEPQPWEFRAKPVLSKIFVITAGVLMNLLLTVLVFWGINYYNGKPVTYTTKIGIVEPSSLADSAGFKSGDVVSAVNGKSVDTWEGFREELIINSMGSDPVVTVNRNGEQLTFVVDRKFIPKDETTQPFLLPSGMRPLIGDIAPGLPAEAAGFKPNDIILNIDGTEIFSAPQTTSIISSSPGKNLNITVLRDKDTVNLAVVPGSDGKIGIVLAAYHFEGKQGTISYGFFGSFSQSFSDVGKFTVLTFTMLKRVITGQMEFGKAFGGPVKIAQYAARSADSGMLTFLHFLAMLSLSLAILNILPFPVLDGGHLVIIIIEGFMRREISIKVKSIIMNIGLYLLLALMAFVIYNDIFGR